MSVDLVFSCSGCDAVEPGLSPLRGQFISFSGQSHGWGERGAINSDVFWESFKAAIPPGWQAFDSYTYATYCPACWETILAPKRPELTNGLPDNPEVVELGSAGSTIVMDYESAYTAEET